MGNPPGWKSKIQTILTIELEQRNLTRENETKSDHAMEKPAGWIQSPNNSDEGEAPGWKSNVTTIEMMEKLRW